MAPKSQAKIKPQGTYTQFFFRFSILNLCSEMFFLGSNLFKIYGCWLEGYTQTLFQVHYYKLMFWNTFFEGAIYLKFMVAD